MNWKILWNHLSQAFISIKRNSLMSLASVTTITASMVTLGTVFLFVGNLNMIVARHLDETKIYVFIDREMDEVKSLSVKAKIDEVPQVASTKYISKQETVDIIRKRNPNAKVDEFLPEIDLPAQVEVKVDRAESAEVVARELENMSGVEKVNSGKGIIQKLITVRNMVQRGGIIAVLLLAMVALLTVNNTIHLTITAREEEINIMQLVGATGWYVKAPFLLEGIIHGLVGAGLSLAVLSLGYGRLSAYVHSKLPFLQMAEGELLFGGLIALVASTAIFFGFLGSYISVRRLLHVE